MGTALTLLAILVALVAIPLLVNRVARRQQSDVDDYMDEQHGDGTGRDGSWPGGGGHIGMGG